MTFDAVRPTQLVTAPESARTDGVIVMDLATATREHADIVRKHLYETVKPDEWKFVALNAALWSSGWFVYIPSGVEASVPVSLSASGTPHFMNGDQTSLAAARTKSSFSRDAESLQHRRQRLDSNSE